MCAANSPCRSSPRSGSSNGNRPDNPRIPQQHPSHAYPFSYYPPPCPHCNPYDPYAPYHPGAFYPPSQCNNIAQESKTSSIFSTVFLILLVLCGVSFIFYRFLSREVRQRVNATLPSPLLAPQSAKRKRDANQNYPTEFIQCSDIVSQLDKRYNYACEDCDKNSPASLTLRIPEKRSGLMHEDRNTGVIEIPPESKVSVATDISNTNTAKVARSTTP